MSKFTTKAQFLFEPGVSGVVLDAVGVQHTSNSAFAPTLGDLSFIPYRRARLKYKLALSAASTAGAVDLVLNAGGVERARIPVAIAGGGAAIIGAADVDLSGIAGESAITLSVDVTTVADAGVTASVFASLDVAVPLIVSGC